LKSVYKYTLPVIDAQTVLFMLRGARIVHVDSQGIDHGSVQIWAIVDPSLAPDDTEARAFSVYGTGHDVPDESDYVGTALAANGALVWHVFEESLPIDPRSADTTRRVGKPSRSRVGS
jgi:hypothetical protein